MLDVGKIILNKRILPFLNPYFSRPFSNKDSKKVLILFEPNRISFSQMYPFMHYQAQLTNCYNVEFRWVSTNQISNRLGKICSASDLVFLQTWYDIEEHEMSNILDSIISYNQSIQISYFDSFAPTDLRLSRFLNGRIHTYVTKSKLKNEDQYFVPLNGDTNLADYYGRLYGLNYDLFDWGVPPNFLSKVKLGPGFLTAPSMLPVFESKDIPSLMNRNIDVHARLGAKEGIPWYHSMRKDSIKSIGRLNGVNLVQGTGVPKKHFMKELKNSKLCFSPFGYGEICWRDVEAILSGCLLIKPDMGHIDTDPNIYIPGVTYVPISWDFSDLEEKVQYYLERDEDRIAIAKNAYDLIAKYIHEEKFVDQMGFLFTV